MTEQANISQEETTAVVEQKTSEKGAHDTSFLDKPGFQFNVLLVYQAPLLVIAVVVLFIVENIAALWRPLGLIFYLALWLFAAFFIFGASVSDDQQLTRSSRGHASEEISAAIVFISFSIFLISFSQFARHVYILMGGFNANNAGYWHWLRFGAANFLEGFLFDIPAVYQWKTTEVEATAFGTQTLVFIFRTSLEYLVIIQVSRMAKLAWKLRDKGGKSSGKSTFYFGFLFKQLGVLILWFICIVIFAAFIGGMVNDGFSMDYWMKAFKAIIPLFLSLWLAWQSLRALFIMKGGKLNWWFALAGLAAGVMLVRHFWPVMKSFIGF